MAYDSLFVPGGKLNKIQKSKKKVLALDSRRPVKHNNLSKTRACNAGGKGEDV
jgi:hypothetical protein